MDDKSRDEFIVDSKVIKETIEGFRVYKLNFNDEGIPHVK